MSFWSLEIAVSVVGLALAAYVFSFYYGSGVRRTSIGRKLTAAVGVFTAQMLVTIALSLYLARRFSADVAVPMLVITALEVVGLTLITLAVRE
ncbi:hypothetical protein [Acidilobus sp.]|jgi:hypothetical protein|uniref:hypothetical protein n=1 Tax=Acidilobus sp. TaxID=1872109 RepID=UPI003CFEE1E3